MKILPINHFLITKSNNRNTANRFYLNKDTVSFSGKTNINYEIQKLPSDAFPSVELQQFILQSISSNPDADIVQLHRQYYSNLLNCETLEDAKKLYPEFNDVVDAKTLNLSRKPPNNVFCQIKNGNIKGFETDSLSLMMLKKYYAELIPVNVDYIKEKFGISYTAFNTLIDTLNLSMDKRYLKLLGLKMRANSMQSAWTTESMQVKRADTFKKTVSTPEYKQKASIASKKRWENPEYRKNLTEKIREARRSPEGRAKTAQITKQLWQDEEYQKKMKINNKAATLAWELHPYAKQVYKEIAKEFPELKGALEARRKGLAITDRQSRVLSQYYKTCMERYPDLKKELSIMQKELLAQWGYYDENRNVDEILAFIQKSYL